MVSTVRSLPLVLAALLVDGYSVESLVPGLAPEEGSGLGPPAPGQQPPGGLRGPQPGDHLVTQTWPATGKMGVSVGVGGLLRESKSVTV